MSSKFRTEFITPWNYMKAREEVIPKMFRCEALAPFGPRDSMTYFNNRKNVDQPETTITAYDRLHDRTPYDQRKHRCDRIKRDSIWKEIHEENKRHKVAILTSHWHGRPNRIALDDQGPEFGKTGTIRNNFYRRNGINLSQDYPAVERQFRTIT